MWERRSGSQLWYLHSVVTLNNHGARSNFASRSHGYGNHCFFRVLFRGALKWKLPNNCIVWPVGGKWWFWTVVTIIEYHSKYLNPNRNPPKYLSFKVLSAFVLFQKCAPLDPICKFGPNHLYYQSRHAST
jgi:hypothetical protein